MSDFYSVLRQSMIDRNLRSPQQREAAYAQARAAMVRRLWALDPPLSDDEIDARIGQFDVAVDRIEKDLLETFAEPEPELPRKPPTVRVSPARRAPPPPPASPQPPPPPPVAEAADEDPLPVRVRQAAATTRALPAPAPTPQPAMDARSAAVVRARSARSALDETSLAIEAALRGAPAPEPPVAGPARVAPRAAPAVAPPPPPPPMPVEYYDDVREERAYEEPPFEEPLDEGPVVEAEEPYPARRYPAVDDDAYPSITPLEDDEEPVPAAPRQKRARKSSGGGAVWLLVVAIVALLAVIVGLGVYLLGPMLTGQGPTRAEAPGTRTAAPAGQAFSLFDGRDPTVFEGNSDNPVRFSGGADGFARIASSASSAGVRAVIGPGLAIRLAGRNIRVTMMSRTAAENGADRLRFAYQSGLAMSHWQTAALGPNFTPSVLEWRAPALRTSPDNDYLLIEPGLPGSGAAADISAIRIEVL